MITEPDLSGPVQEYLQSTSKKAYAPCEYVDGAMDFDIEQYSTV